jgi:ribosomal-protein-alanine N-acetyltransferase
MRRGDVAAVAALEAAAFSSPWREDTFHRLLDEDTVLLRVAETCAARPTVVGYGVVLAVADEGEIANLAVDARLRGRGLGGRLLDALLGAAAGAGVRRLYLEVRPSNEVARTLYATRGFAVVGRRRDYYDDPREDALVLALEVEDSTPDDGTHS